MPPPKSRKKLTAAQKETLKKWIAEGAEYQAHWSFITPERPKVPEVKNKAWVRNPIDNFILAELENGAPLKRVGFDVEGRQPVREGTKVLDAEGSEVGRITSGGFSPSLQRPIAMGYVATHLADTGTALKLEQRGKLFDARVAAMPFVPHRYHRKGASA